MPQKYYCFRQQIKVTRCPKNPTNCNDGKKSGCSLIRTPTPEDGLKQFTLKS